MSYVVIDNFIDPSILDRVRESSLQSGIGSWRPPEGKVGSSIYDGIGFWGEHAVMLAELMRHLGQTVVPNTMFFRSTNEGMEDAYIHSDRMKGTNTCIVYLTDHNEEYGTAFYKHVDTELEGMPTFEEQEAMGVSCQLKEDMENRDGFVETGRVTGRKNRAIVFPAPLFHSRLPVSGFGKSPEDGRMVWVTHFYRRLPDGTLA